MSSFNETVSRETFQCGTGTVGVTPEKLVNATDKPVHKHVFIENTSTDRGLHIFDEKVTATKSVTLLAGRSIKIPVDRANWIRVRSDSSTVAYTWYSI